MSDLLFLCHRIPYPPDKGDKIRSYNWLRGLAGDHRIHLAAFIDDARDGHYVDAVRGFCEDAFFVRLGRHGTLRRAPAGLLRGEALTLASYRHAGLSRWVRDRARSVAFQSVLVFSSGMAPYALEPSLSRARRVMDFVDMDSEKWRQYAATANPGLRWLYNREGRLVLQAERRFAQAFDASTFVSAPEAELFRARVPDVPDVEVVPNGVDCDYFNPDRGYADPYEGGPALVFTGAMNYAANVDAVDWFAHEVFRGVRSKVNRARFYIVGHRPTPAVRRLERLPGVVVTGSVEDVRPYLAHARAVVAPLRIARGIQNKVLEALAMDKRILATPQAFDGIEGYTLNHDTVNEMPTILEAAAVRYLTEDASACDGARREFVMRHYSWETSIGKMAALLAGNRPGSTQSSPSQIAGRSA